MSVKSRLLELKGVERVEVNKDHTLHGERGTEYEIVYRHPENGLGRHILFLADKLKVDEHHAVDILKSHFWRTK